MIGITFILYILFVVVMFGGIAIHGVLKDIRDELRKINNKK